MFINWPLANCLRCMQRHVSPHSVHRMLLGVVFCLVVVCRKCERTLHLNFHLQCLDGSLDADSDSKGGVALADDLTPSAVTSCVPAYADVDAIQFAICAAAQQLINLIAIFPCLVCTLFSLNFRHFVNIYA